MIHHFGSKEGLRKACDDYIAEQVREAKSESLRTADPANWHIDSTPTVTTANQFNDVVPAVTPANFHVTSNPAVTPAVGFQKW